MVQWGLRIVNFVVVFFLWGNIVAFNLKESSFQLTFLSEFHSTDYEGIHNLEPESPLNHSGSPTPRNSPRPPARSVQTTLPMQQPLTLLPSTVSVTRAPLSHQSIKDQSFTDSLENQSDISSSQDIPSSAATTTTTTASATSTVYDDDTKLTLPAAPPSLAAEGKFHERNVNKIKWVPHGKDLSLL